MSGSNHPQPSSPGPQWTASWQGYVPLTLASLALLGWASQIVVLTRILPWCPPMRPLTALALVLASLAWLGRKSAVLRRALALLVVACGVAALEFSAIGGRLWLAVAPLAERMSLPESLATQMTLETAVAIILLGVALGTLYADGEASPIGHGHRHTRWLAGAVILIPMLQIVGQGYRPDLGLSPGMPLTTSIALICLGIGILQTHPNSGFMNMLNGPGPGGTMLRRFFPVAMVLLIGAREIRLFGEYTGLITGTMGATLGTGLTVAILAGLVWRSALIIDGQDLIRRETKDALAVTATESESARLALAVIAEDAESTRQAMAVGAEALAVSAAEAESTRRDLAVTAKALAVSAAEAESTRRDLAVTAKALAVSAAEAESTRRDLAVTAKALAVSAAEAESTRRDLVVTAKALAVSAAEAESTRRALAVSAAEAESTRRTLEVTTAEAASTRQALAVSAAEVKERSAREHDLRQALDRLEVMNHEQAAFSYSVSHDLRTPLRALDGFSQVLLEDYATALDETGRGYLERIRKASQRMARLIDDLLELSRITRLDLRGKAIDLSALATEVALELAHGDPERHLVIEVAPAMAAWGDPGLVRVVFDNLLGNAWKFTGKQPSARITVSAETVGSELVVCVGDNGAGFDNQYRDNLFQPFSRLVTPVDYPGTGIGLATVQRIVARHGGRVWAEGIPDEGANFYFTLQLSAGVDANAQPGPTSPLGTAIEQEVLIAVRTP